MWCPRVILILSQQSSRGANESNFVCRPFVVRVAIIANTTGQFGLFGFGCDRKVWRLTQSCQMMTRTSRNPLLWLVYKDRL